MYLCDVDDEVHQLLDGDCLVPVGVRQPHHLPGDALGGHDGVEGVAGDGVVLADEVRHRLQQLDDVATVVVLHHVDAKCGRRRFINKMPIKGIIQGRAEKFLQSLMREVMSGLMGCASSALVLYVSG